MTALAQMYQAAILEHARRTRHRGVLDPADARQEGVNPSCGDELLLTLRFGDDTVTEVRYEGKGCAISQASASLMAEAIEGLGRDEALALIGHVKAMIHGEGLHPDLGEVAVLEGVRRLPARVKCAALAWTTLEAALRTHPAGDAAGEAPGGSEPAGG
ncbi:MAG: SUF system NifU family Fe-S cluster assembly protein [Trueperaceae bacterium]|nr:SUF system NifU family Fe-S cluster assembly protein [Trueperaceae bacterium]